MNTLWMLIVTCLGNQTAICSLPPSIDLDAVYRDKERCEADGRFIVGANFGTGTVTFRCENDPTLWPTKTRELR